MSGSFSQTLGSFLRISYMVLPSELRERLLDLQGPGGEVSYIQEIILRDFLASGHFERQINRIRTYYRRVREEAVDEFENFDNLQVRGVDQGLFFSVCFKGQRKTWEEIDQRAKEKNIYIDRPGNYQAQAEKKPKTFIFGFARLNLENVRQAVRIFVQTIS